ncbi:MAG: ATPase, T2SS/T4P/T4SS family, partial [Planctomycetota bacterium]
MKDDAPTNDPDAPVIVDDLLAHAVRAGASDVHIDPHADAHRVRLRVDGLLSDHAQLDPAAGRAVVTRLMVMAQLLTYRLEIPQEGQLTFNPPNESHPVEMRLAVMPTTHGLRAVLRLPAEMRQPQTLERLNMPESVYAALKRFAAVDSGMLLVTGPAGSGKTTTLYALLSHIANT